ncbi:hypothetical protein BT69DRAFT_1352548 [Atractiella rhizophila]|nr:hypothetical protein BT69DRAFT_1352548 [Atractiella rhizophila]
MPPKVHPVTHLRCKYDKITIIVEATPKTTVSEIRERFWEALQASGVSYPTECTIDDVGIHRGVTMDGGIRWELMENRSTVFDARWKDASMIGIGWRKDGEFESPSIKDPQEEQQAENDNENEE